MQKTIQEDKEEAVTSHYVGSDSLWQTCRAALLPLNQICLNFAVISGLTCRTLQTLDGADGGIEAREAVIT